MTCGWLNALCALLPLAALSHAQAECTLSVIDVSFGAYDTLADADTNIAGGISVNCDTETAGQVSLSTGNGSFAARRLESGADALFYNLYLDPAHLSVWGDGSPGTSLLSFHGTGGSFTVYGHIPARQNVRVGAYGDTITVTLTF